MKRAKAGEFNPVYCLQSDVDISSIALTGMKQLGLCVMKSSRFEFHPDDTYSTVDEKLRIIFPKLFDWLCELEPYDKIDACRFGKLKVGIANHILFIGKLYYVI